MKFYFNTNWRAKSFGQKKIHGVRLMWIGPLFILKVRR